MREGPRTGRTGHGRSGKAGGLDFMCRPVEELTKRQPFKGSPNLRFSSSGPFDVTFSCSQAGQPNMDLEPGAGSRLSHRELL